MTKSINQPINDSGFCSTTYIIFQVHFA